MLDWIGPIATNILHFSCSFCQCSRIMVSAHLVYWYVSTVCLFQWTCHLAVLLCTQACTLTFLWVGMVEQTVTELKYCKIFFCNPLSKWFVKASAPFILSYMMVLFLMLKVTEAEVTVVDRRHCWIRTTLQQGLGKPKLIITLAGPYHMSSINMISITLSRIWVKIAIICLAV